MEGPAYAGALHSLLNTSSRRGCSEWRSRQRGQPEALGARSVDVSSSSGWVSCYRRDMHNESTERWSGAGTEAQDWVTLDHAAAITRLSKERIRTLIREKRLMSRYVENENQVRLGGLLPGVDPQTVLSLVAGEDPPGLQGKNQATFRCPSCSRVFATREIFVDHFYGTHHCWRP